MSGSMKGNGPKPGNPGAREEDKRPTIPPLHSTLKEAELGKLLANHALAVHSVFVDGPVSLCRAWDSSLGQEVSVKVFSGWDGDDYPQRLYRQRFMQQAEVCRLVDHPNVEKVFRVVDAGERIIVVSEQIKGRTFSHMVENGPLSWGDARGIFLQLCEGMIAVHRGGIIHLNLNPDNVILGEKTLKIVDFSMATFPSEIEKRLRRLDGSVFGVPEYAAPERAKGMKADERSDIYSIGSMLYHALSGSPPFVRDPEKGAQESWFEVCLKVVHEPPVPLNVKAPLVPRKVSDLVMKCLAKSPHERFQSVEDLKEAILEC